MNKSSPCAFLVAWSVGTRSSVGSTLAVVKLTEWSARLQQACTPWIHKMILLGLNAAGIDVWRENSSSFWMVLKWYQSVNSHKVAKHLDIYWVEKHPRQQMLSYALWTWKAAPFSQESSTVTHRSSQQQSNSVIAIRIIESSRAPPVGWESRYAQFKTSTCVHIKMQLRCHFEIETSYIPFTHSVI